MLSGSVPVELSYSTIPPPGLKKYRVLPGAGGTVSGEAEKKSLPRPSIVRKRSYSFSDGHIKHPTMPPVRRWTPGRSGGGRGRGAGGSGGGTVHTVHPRPSDSFLNVCLVVTSMTT